MRGVPLYCEVLFAVSAATRPCEPALTSKSNPDPALYHAQSVCMDATAISRLPGETCITTAAERRGDNMKGLKDIYLKAKAEIGS